MGKSFAYFFLGFLTALIVVELTDGKPAKKAIHSDINSNYQYQEPYLIEEIPLQDTFNNQRTNESKDKASKLEIWK